jgi:phytoene desaturase
MREIGMDGRPHAVVIGSGFGGLAAAVRLGARGFRVTVLEKLDRPGGRAYVYKDEGFTFDAGPTIITAPYLIEELWTLAGRRLADDLTIRPIDPFYRIRFDDGDEFVYSGDHEAMRREVAKFEPADLPGFERFLALSAEIYKAGFTDLAHVPFHGLGTLARSIPDMVRLAGYRSVHARVAQFFSNEKLRIVFSFHPLLIGGNPFTTTSYYCLIAHLERSMGVHYCEGGMGRLIEGIAGLIGHLRGKVRCDAEVDEIIVENGRAVGVSLAGGERIAADVVVSNAEVGHTYTRLLRNHPRRVWTDRKIARADYAMSLFVWYFGTKRRYEDVYHHTMVLGPRYRALLDDIFLHKRLAEDCSLYLHRPSATDPSLAPPGCDAFYVLSPVPHLGGGADWAVEAEPYRRRIERRLEETLLPGLRDAIVTSRMLTPLDFGDRLLSTNGSAFAFEPKLFQSAWFRPHNLSEEAEGLYLVGAGTHPGAGIPGVLSSAKVLDAIVPDPSDVLARRRVKAGDLKGTP